MNKNLMYCRLLLSVITSFTCAVSMAYDFCVDGIYYNKTSDMTVEVTSGDEVYTGDVVIPSVILDEYFVTGIDGESFIDSKIKSITIPPKIKTIQANAFSSCFYLKKVIVKDLAAWCSISFGDVDANPLNHSHHLYSDVNTEITNLSIPYGIKSINDYAFVSCRGLINVTIPSSVESIGAGAFAGCNNLPSVTIPPSVSVIREGSFSGCKGIEYLNIPEGVEKIEDSAFSGCSKLKEVTIPSSLKMMGEAFSGCNKLMKIHISDLSAWCKIIFSNRYANPLQFSKHLYKYGQEIKHLIIPDEITQIREFTFYGCEGIESVTLHGNLTTIGSTSFQYSGISSILIPRSVREIGESPFLGCSNLTDIVVESGNDIYDSRENCNGIIRTSSNTLIQGCRNTIIPNSVTHLDRYSFCLCQGLVSMDIPDGVRWIDVDAFNSCPDLEKIIIPSSVSSIYTTAFYNCPKLVNVTSYMSKPPHDNSNFWRWFSPDTYALATLYVPRGLKAVYESTTGWNKFVNIVEFDIPSGVAEVIDDNSAVEEYYDINGLRITAPKHGLNIVRMNDGSVRKVLVK